MTGTSDLYFRQLLVGEMANLAYLVGSVSTREALVVDPAWSVDAMLDQADQDEMNVVGALVTHYHQDHIGGSLFGHEIEGLKRFLERNPSAAVHVNRHEAAGVAKVADLAPSDLTEHEGGDVIEVGGLRIRLLHTPGHTPGSQCFLVEEGGQPGQLVSGDTLFLGSCGRVDLPGSDPEAMYHSLRHLCTLPDDTLLLPGHNYAHVPNATMGETKSQNTYLNIKDLETWKTIMGG